MNKYLFLYLGFFLSSFIISYGQAVSINGSTDDQVIYSNETTKWVGQQDHRVGDKGSGGIDGCAVFPFQLPALNSGEVIVSASFSIKLNSITNSPQGQVDMYGLPYRSTSAVDASGDYFQGDYGTDNNATALQDDFATLATPTGQYVESNTTGDDNLVAYINAQYTAGAQGGDFIFIRLNPDYPDVGNSKYWIFASANSSNKPKLDLVIEDRPVTGVSIDQTGPITIAPGMTTNLTASISPSDAVDKTVTWSSSNSSIASVNSEGVVTAGSTESPATITVTTNNGGFTDNIEIIVDCSAVPSPANFTAMKGDREITLNWDAVNGVDGYSIKYGTSEGGSYGTTVNIADGDADNTVISGLTNGIPYYFIIATVNGICESDPSSEVTATPSDIYEYTGPNVYISTVESGNNLGQGMSAVRINGQPANKNGFGSFIPLDFVIDIDAPNAVDDLNACLTFSYDPESLPEGMNLASLTLYRFDDVAQVWVKMGGYSDVDNNTVKLCGIGEFSNWTLAGSVPESVPLNNWGIILIFLVVAGIVLIRKI